MESLEYEQQAATIQNIISTNDDVCVLWHCRNLRTQDHGGLEYAIENYSRIVPVFIFDPTFYTSEGLACDARIEFMLESLKDLNEQYAEFGGELSYFHGDPVDILSLFDELGVPVVTTADPTGRYGFRRDNAVADRCSITFVDADGLRRDVEETRDNWDEHIKSWFTDSILTHDAEAVSTIDIPTEISPSIIQREYQVHSEKSIERCGGTKAACEILDVFIDQLRNYPGNISSPNDARTGTSQLSPYLRFGCLSVREVYQRVRDCNISGRPEEMFISRLFWNKHYNQKLADWHGWMDTAVNPILEDFHADSHDPELVTAWKHGNTGYPLVDASMRCLKETGWLNFRMRAMCASVLCDLMQQPWKIGADWFYYHLLDADPAINYTQFQLQAGVDGTNMMRIYNPRKQVRDNDPDGEFIHEWVPELQSLPAKYLDQPEKTPINVQKDVGVSIGDDYPYPVVEYEHARHEIIEKMEQVREQAHQALRHPEVNRRASLSQRGGTTTEEDIGDIDSLREENEVHGQSSLDEFN